MVVYGTIAFHALNKLLRDASFESHVMDIDILPADIYPFIKEQMLRPSPRDWSTAREQQRRYLERFLPHAKAWRRSGRNPFNVSLVKLIQAILKELEQIETYEMMEARNNKGLRKVHLRWYRAAGDWLDQQCPHYA